MTILSCSLAYVFHPTDLLWKSLSPREDRHPLFNVYQTWINCLSKSFVHFSDRLIIFFLINRRFSMCSEFETSTRSTHCAHFLRLSLALSLWACVCGSSHKERQNSHTCNQISLSGLSSCTLLEKSSPPQWEIPLWVSLQHTFLFR